MSTGTAQKTAARPRGNLAAPGRAEAIRQIVSRIQGEETWKMAYKQYQKDHGSRIEAALL